MTTTPAGPPAAAPAAAGTTGHQATGSKGWGTRTYRKRYELDRLEGRPRTVNPARARAHLEQLLALGVRPQALADAARVKWGTVARILDPATRRILATTESLIVAVTAADVTRDRHSGYVPIIGAHRRIRALMAIGWTHRHITAAMHAHDPSVRVTSVDVLGHAGALTLTRTAAAVRAAFDSLSGRPGPSARTQTRARSSGYAPPLAWDDHALDDPSARPRGVAAVPAPRRTA